MKNKLILFIAGLALIIFYHILSGSNADENPAWVLTLMTATNYLGFILMVSAVGITIYWIVTENRDIPAVEYLDTEEEDLNEATPEILYFLDQGLDVKKIVATISINFNLKPKLVYEHVVNLISERDEAASQYDQAIDPLHGGIRISKKFTKDDIYFGTDKEDI